MNATEIPTIIRMYMSRGWFRVYRHGHDVITSWAGMNA